jgi:hypothetical protein
MLQVQKLASLAKWSPIWITFTPSLRVRMEGTVGVAVASKATDSIVRGLSLYRTGVEASPRRQEISGYVMKIFGNNLHQDPGQPFAIYPASSLDGVVNVVPGALEIPDVARSA